MKTLAFLLLSLLSARADLIIYNYTSTQTVVGGGIQRTIRPVGVLMWDADNGNATTIAVFNHVQTGKRLVVADQSDSLLYQAEGSIQGFTAVIGTKYASVPGLTTQSSSFTFGVNTKLTLRPGRTVWLPRTGRITGYALLRQPSNDFFGPASGVYSFSPTRTKAANTLGESYDAAVARFRAVYAARGYVE